MTAEPRRNENSPPLVDYEGHSEYASYDAPNAPIPRKGIADYVGDVIR